MRNNDTKTFFGLLTAGIIFITLAATLSCGPGTDQKKEDPVFAVSVMPAVTGELYDYLEVNGDVDTLSSIDVFASKNGEVISIVVAVGQWVEAGQIIAKIDPSRPGQQFVPNPVSAPISGTIVSIPVRIGSTISVSTPIAKIARTNDLVINTSIAERFTARMRVGLDALVRLEAFPGEQFPARVTEVSPIVDPSTRTLAVKLMFLGGTDRIKPGMFASIKIITEKKRDIVKIPSNAMVRRGDTMYVFVVNNESMVEKREIVPGINIDNKLQVVQGLAAGENVVIQGQKSLDDKTKVRVIETLPALSPEDSL